MASIRILLGRARWRRRKATAAWTSVDAAGRPDLIYVTDSQRKRLAVEREAAARARFPPEVRVLAELLHDLWGRHGDGRAILSNRGLRLLAGRVIADAAPGSDLREWASGAREDAPAAMARLARAMGEARLAEPPAEAPSGLRDGVRALRRAAASHPRVVDESAAFEALIRQMGDPGPGLGRWLGRRRLAVVDDVVTASPLRIAAILALARGWAGAGTDVVLAFETGRAAGGAEAGAVLGFDDPPPDWPVLALAAGAPLRRAVLEDLVATGEASLLLATPDGVEPLEPGVEISEEAPDPSDAAWAVEAGPVAARPELRLVRASDPAAELRGIAGEVRLFLESGGSPEDCLVALPGLDARVDEVAEAFDDVGVPIALGPGLPLGTSPAAVAIRRAAGLALRGCPAGDVLAFLGDRAVGGTPASTLLRWTRAARLEACRLLSRPTAVGLFSATEAPDVVGWRDGLAGWLGRSRAGDPGLVEAAARDLEAVVAGFPPLGHRSTAPAWREALIRTLAIGRDPAWGAAIREIDDLVAELVAIDPLPWPAATLAVEADEALSRARWQPSAGAVGAVPVVGLLEVRGLGSARVWLGGLVDGAVPKAVHRSAAERAALPIDALAEARQVVASALRDALDDPRARGVTLSWFAQDGSGDAVAPSPVLAELLAVRSAGGGRLSDTVEEAVEPSFSASEALRRAARQTPRRPDLIVQRVAWEARADDRFGAFDAIGAGPARPTAHLSVTAFETYLRCPFRFWADRVLALTPDLDEGLDPDRRRLGTALHRILERFAARGGLDRGRAGRPELLATAAIEALAALAAEGGIEPALAEWIRDRWTAGLASGEDGSQRPKGILAAWLALEEARGGSPVAVEQAFAGLAVGPIQLRGAIDRVDRVGADGPLLVLDYKSGSAPRAKEISAGLALQPLAYLASIEERNPGVPVAAAFVVLRRADEVRRTGWIGDPSAIDACCDASERRSALALDASERRELLAKAATAAENLVEGRFPTTVLGADLAGCDRCPHGALCRVDHARNRRVAEGS